MNNKNQTKFIFDDNDDTQYETLSIEELDQILQNEEELISLSSAFESATKEILSNLNDRNDDKNK